MITRTYFISLSVAGHTRHRLLYRKCWRAKPQFVLEDEITDYAKMLGVDPNVVRVNSFNLI